MNTGRVHFSKEDIGAEILPILTTGLYRDTLDALREYIQNAIDAQSDHIELSIDPDVVSIIDNGIGMTLAEARRAIRFGISEKNPKENVGFRGIGIYSAFNLCDALEIFTRSTQDNIAYKLYFNFKRIRHDLKEEQEGRTRGQPPQLYLERLLEDSVFVEPTSNDWIEGHGTKVVMSGILSETYLRLNDWKQVVKYLQNVVPLPFSPQFKFSTEIKEKFDKEDYRVVPLTLQIGRRREKLYRPYTDNIFKFEGRHSPEFFTVQGGKQRFGFAWVCVNDARETIKDEEVRGLLIKKFGFSIADRRYLEPYFGRTVYSRRITGEVIIKNDTLIPNAARSDFENNSTRQAFLEALPKFTREVDKWANKIQEDERAIDVLAELTEQLNEINNELPSIQRDSERLLKLNAQLAEIERQMKQQEKRLQVINESGLMKSKVLLGDIQGFVREGLLSQRRSTQKIEQEIVKAIQRKAVGPTESEQARVKSLPNDVITLLEAYGPLDSLELRSFLQFLDHSILKAYLDQAAYSEAIRELRNYLEENL
jgi:molecular chaperone HtpG